MERAERSRAPVTRLTANHARQRREAATILGAAVAIAAIEVGFALAAQPADRGLLELLRSTARTSAGWFVLAFAAAPLVALAPSPSTKWLLRNRRYLGLAMAISHFVHLLAIVILAARHGAAFWAAIAPTTLVGGGIGYVLLAAMVATSTDHAAVTLGRRRWRALHLTGMWALWSIFAFTYAGQIGRSTFADLATPTLLALATLRIAAAVHRRRRRRRA